MIKYLILFSLIFSSVSVWGYYPNYTNFSNQKKFTSKLKMNKPNIIIDGHKNYNLRPRHPHHHCCPEFHEHLSKRELSELEKYALNKNYNQESNLERLERLEELAFGSIQSGNIISRYNNLKNVIYSRPRYGTKQSVLGKIANYFGNNITGYTPNIVPSYFIPTISPVMNDGYSPLGGYNNNFYPAPGYSNNNYEQYSNGIFGGGWGLSGHDYGTGSSIRILD